MALAGATLALVAAGAAATERYGVAVEALAGPGWSSGPARVELRYQPDGGLDVDLRFARLALPALLQPLRGLRLSCAAGRVDAAGPRCTRGTLSFVFPALSPHRLRAPLRFDARDGTLRLHAGPLKLDGGTLTLDADSRAGRWSLVLSVKGVELATVARALAPNLLPVALTKGNIDARIELGGGRNIGRGTVHGMLTGLSFSDRSGLHAGEGVTVALSGSLRPEQGSRALSVDLSVSAGQIFLDPIFVDAGKVALSLHADGHWSAPARRVALDHFVLAQDGLAEVSGRLTIRGKRLDALHAELALTNFAPVFKTYVAPWLAGVGLDRATVAGRIGATLDWRDGVASAAELRFQRAAIRDPEGRLTLADVSGVLRWDGSGPGRESRLRIGSGRLYRFALGATEIATRISGRELELTRPAVLPILDGALRIDRLRAHDVGRDAFGYTLSGRLAPVSLERITAALGWPRFGGTLGGEIPRIEYARGTLRMDGDMPVRVFDGVITLHGLRIERPFGVAPRLETDVEIRGLSLETLTRTFSFGRILGRLDGRVRGLVLEDWLPSAFDARLETPEGDDSRHRISQRAVNDLARIGGAGGMLSSVFLGLFNEFSYARLGLSCRLRAGSCRMDGVAPAKGGFYIVEGGGMPPRIDVVGYNHQVDWETLIRRLQAITRSKGPVVR